jgi:hypothetical protein
MNEPDYSETESEEKRRLLRSFGYWDLVALGALVGAGLGFLYGFGDESRQRAWHVFGGMAVGAICVFIAGWGKVQLRARERFFTRWATRRQWSYKASGQPFEDTPLLRGGDRRNASDVFSDFWTMPGAVLYQHKRITGSGRNERVSNYLVLHFRLGRPLVPLLRISPHSHIADLGEKLLGDHELIGRQIELESTELTQQFRIEGLAEDEDEIRKLLAPSAIVIILGFRRALPDAHVYFEIEGAVVAFAVEMKLSPKRPEAISELLELWKPIADWLIEEAGPAGGTPS